MLRGRDFAGFEAWSLPVQVQPFKNWPANDRPINTWAPEVHWDPVQKNYAILWSSATALRRRRRRAQLGRIGEGPGRKVKPDPRHHRTFISRTADFQNFTDAQVFFSPGVSEIDAMMAFDDRGTADPSDDRWVLVCKDEQMPGTGRQEYPADYRPGRSDETLPAAVPFAHRPEPAWSEPVAGPGSSVQASQWAEGPTLLRVGDEWRLYFDRFRLRANRFGLATSHGPRSLDRPDQRPDGAAAGHARHDLPRPAFRGVVHTDAIRRFRVPKCGRTIPKASRP